MDGSGIFGPSGRLDTGFVWTRSRDLCLIPPRCRIVIFCTFSLRPFYIAVKTLSRVRIPIIDNLARMLPFLWPHRRRVYLSMFFAFLVAILWALNLSFTFLVVKVYLEGQSIGQYVKHEIRESEAEKKDRTARLESLDARLGQLAANERNDQVLKSKLNDKQAREQQKLSTVSRRLMVLYWVDSKVLKLVPDDRFDTFALILGLILLLTIIKGVCIFIQDVLTGGVVELVVMGVRKHCFRSTLKLDYQTLTRNGTGDLMSRFTNDVNVMSSGLLLLGGKVLREPLKAMICIVCAFAVNWRLTLLAILFVPVFGFVFYRFGRSLKKAAHRTMESMSRIYKSLEETFDSLKIVIAFNGARRHRQRFHRENKEYYKEAMKVVQIDAMTSPTTEFLGMLAVLIVLLPGAYLVLRQTTQIWDVTLTSYVMDIADLSLLYAYMIGTMDPIRKLSSVYAKLKRSTAAIDRIAELMDQTSLVTDPKQPRLLPRHSRSISFQHVNFTYANIPDQNNSRPPALKNVSLDVEAGEIIAVVGENGSGKSTLVNLLPRFFDADQGRILIDDVNIQDVRLRDLRNQIGIVTQETLLFDDTIYENIRYGNPNASSAAVLAAAHQANVLQFAEQLPDGLDTSVGEKGQLLSGGQRQRIALARAILRDPAILILDEATSAIDAHSEAMIHESLAQLADKRTVFMITHSVSKSMLSFVSRIAVMVDGELVAVGPHATLIESCPVYRNLYDAQVRQRSAA